MLNMKTFLSSLVIFTLLFLSGSQSWSEEVEASQDKVIFHVDESANAHWAMMLAGTYLEDYPEAKVIFVAYGPGVDFMLTGTKDKRGNTYVTAINNLVGKGAEFRICAKTLDARNIPQDKILNGIQTVPDGIHEIVRLQSQEGFSYLKP